MISVPTHLLFAGALVWLVSVVVIVAAMREATRSPWWEKLRREIEELPEADPEDPRGRPSQDGRT
jgi:hypothetical protein